MGGHGGLNILPQKRWNVYNFDNREKVRRDEEQAAREEQLKRDQSRRRDTEIRLESLRTARGLAPSIQPPEPEPEPEPEPKPSSDPGHINLFEGIKIFDPIQREGGVEREGTKKRKHNEEGGPKSKPKPAVVVGPEDEKYRLGYGLAGKGVQLPWYLRKPVGDEKDESGDVDRRENRAEKKRKTIEELREERLKRERKEKDRERALRHEKMKSHRDGSSGSRRRS